jgi:hypothetical protein
MSNFAASNASALAASRQSTWTGRVISGLVIAFLVMDAGTKIAALPFVSASAANIGWTADPGYWLAIGLLLLAITALYAWPRTAVLGAILLTGYLGGAVASMPGSTIRCSATLCSGSIWGSLYGAACGCATRASETCCQSAE